MTNVIIVSGSQSAKWDSEPVLFDNIQVTQQHSAILEEDHYYAYGLKIAGISSRKIADVAEGSVGNFNLYNDKKFISDADLDWYDYGFRNYDAQIGRFPQLDPLTWEYPELTNYQYASCEPIGNVDRDGLERISAVANFTYDYTHAASQLFPVFSKAAAPIATGAAKIGARVAIPLANASLNLINRSVQDRTYVKKLDDQIPWKNNISDSKSPYKKIAEWWNSVISGSGSYQDHGTVFSGNANGGGTLDFKDHAKVIDDAIDLGPAFFGVLKVANLDPKVLFEEMEKSAIPLKFLEHSLEAGKTSMEATEAVKETVEVTKENISGRKSKVTTGSGGKQITDTITVRTYNLGPNGDTTGSQDNLSTVPISRKN